MSLNDFEFGKQLGKGAFGSVWIVTRKEDKQIYAMKRVKIGMLGKKEVENSYNEIRLLSSLYHKNIIGYNEAFYDDLSKTLNIVMEYADGGDLSTKIKENKRKHLVFEEGTIWQTLIQTLEGLKYLHEKKIIHRDLKSANIFLTKDGYVKIGDLNVSKITKMGVAVTQTGTPYYASPEIWKDKPYDYKCDIWSIGCIIYEMANLHVPFRGTSFNQLYEAIQKNVYPPINYRYSDDLRQIVRIILETNPYKRPSARDLLQHEIIRRKKWDFGIIDNESRKDKIDSTKGFLMKTIKIPTNLNLLNNQLPKRYEQEKNNDEMLKNDEYETAKQTFFNPDKNSNKNLDEKQIYEKYIKDKQKYERNSSNNGLKSLDKMGYHPETQKNANKFSNIDLNQDFIGANNTGGTNNNTVNSIPEIILIGSPKSTIRNNEDKNTRPQTTNEKKRTNINQYSKFNNINYDLDMNNINNNINNDTIDKLVIDQKKIIKNLSNIDNGKNTLLLVSPPRLNTDIQIKDKRISPLKLENKQYTGNAKKYKPFSDTSLKFNKISNNYPDNNYSNNNSINNYHKKSGNSKPCLPSITSEKYVPARPITSKTPSTNNRKFDNYYINNNGYTPNKEYMDSKTTKKTNTNNSNIFNIDTYTQEIDEEIKKNKRQIEDINRNLELYNYNKSNDTSPKINEFLRKNKAHDIKNYSFNNRNPTSLLNQRMMKNNGKTPLYNNLNYPQRHYSNLVNQRPVVGNNYRKYYGQNYNNYINNNHNNYQRKIIYEKINVTKKSGENKYVKGTRQVKYVPSGNKYNIYNRAIIRNPGILRPRGNNFPSSRDAPRIICPIKMLN